MKGRGAQSNPDNRFLAQRYTVDDPDGLDSIYEPDPDPSTEFLADHARSAISKNNSVDISFEYSVNPYQGCEHGCVYCYARNSHEYRGFSAGLDFEQKILVKHNIVRLLEQEFHQKNYRVSPITLSGNTDCYQPVERKLRLTRGLLELMLKYSHPVSLITKNSLILRDLDLLRELAARDLVQVAITINSLDEELRQKMEPRTGTAQKRLRVIRALADGGVPVRLMCAPVIPGLNMDGIPKLIEAAARHGASDVSYTVVRLNGAIGSLFEDWIYKAYPDRAQKVLNLIASCHEGRVNDNRWGRRMHGDGPIADQIAQLIQLYRRRYMGSAERRPLRSDLFLPPSGKQLDLFK